MNIELIKVLIPVLTETIRAIKGIADSDIDNMTITEIKEMLSDTSEAWPELDFGQKK